MVIKKYFSDLAYYCRDLEPDESVQLIYERVKEKKYSVLLESSGCYIQKTSEFSIISVLPEMLVTLRQSELTLLQLNEKINLKRHIYIDNLVKLKAILYELLNTIKPISSIDAVSHLPFIGGFLGFVSYDFVRYIEKLPDKNMAQYMPDLQFLLTRNAIIIDHKESMLWAISDKKENLDYLIHRVNLNTEERTNLNDFNIVSERKVSFTEDEFIEKVEKIKDYIAQGEIYQANISVKFSQMIDIEPYDLYKMLYKKNPSPFCAFINFNDIVAVSNSPERLIKSYPDKRIETRPIAGTRGRSVNIEEDLRLEKEMLSSAKERSEHIMLVDLERNDIGKVSEYSTVKVDELFTIEKYSHVMHLVSNVSAKMYNKYDCFDLLQAMFPGGTITGVPKIRCMEIIEETEPVRRGLYTGSIGYIDFRESMDFNIVIRSVTLEKVSSKNYYAKMQFGAGIVADSVGKYEYKECIKKGQAIFELFETVK